MAPAADRSLPSEQTCIARKRDNNPQLRTDVEDSSSHRQNTAKDFYFPSANLSKYREQQQRPPHISDFGDSQPTNTPECKAGSWHFARHPGDIAFLPSYYRPLRTSSFQKKPLTWPAWTDAEASRSCERDGTEHLHDPGEETSGSSCLGRNSCKDVLSLTVSDNGLLEAPTFGDYWRRFGTAEQLKKELVFIHVILLVAFCASAMLVVTFYPRTLWQTPEATETKESATPLDFENTSMAPLQAPASPMPVVKDLYDVCSTNSCRREGAQISGLLSRDVDPCDDFYIFVCGQWESQNGKLTDSPDEDLVYRLESDIHKLLLSPSGVRSSEFLSHLRRLMNSCQAAARDSDLDAVFDLLSAADLDGFPFIPPVRSSVSPWKTAAKVFLITGASVLVRLGIAVHPFESDRDVVTIDIPEPLLAAAQSTTTAYRRLVQASMNSFGKLLVPSAYTTEVVQFAQQLDKMALSGDFSHADERQHRVFKLTNLPEIQAYLSEILEDQAFSDKERDVLLLAPDFLRSLLSLVGKSEIHIILNFFCVHVMVRTSMYSSLTDPDLSWAVESQLFGRPLYHVPRWRLCVRATAHVMPYLFLYASHLVVQARTNSLATVLGNVLKQMTSRVDRLIFLDDQTRVLAKRILADVQFAVGGPLWLSDHEQLSDYVRKLPSASTNVKFTTWLSQVSSTVRAEVFQRKSRDTWRGSPFETDCSYDLQLKTVYVPILLSSRSAAQLDEFGSLELPRTGHRVARCLLRMLLEGVSSFFNREILTRSFFSSSAKTSLRQAQLCLQKQVGVPASMSLSLLEDHIALKVIEDLYKASERRSPSSKSGNTRLPGLEDFTVEHLLYVYYALGFCVAGGRQNERLQDQARSVNVPLRGSLAFQEAFGCRPTSRMGPLDNCAAWMTPSKQRTALSPDS